MQYIQRIEKELKSKGLTAKKMLLDLGYGDNLISHWKKGSEPSAIKLQRIADYLNVTTDYLLKGENEVENEKENVKMTTIDSNNHPVDDELKKIAEALKLSMNKYKNLTTEELADIESSYKMKPGRLKELLDLDLFCDELLKNNYQGEAMSNDSDKYVTKKEFDSAINKLLEAINSQKMGIEAGSDDPLEKV